MSIVRIDNPAAIPAAVTDYESQNEQIDALGRALPSVWMTQSGSVPQGFTYYHGGSLYLCTADETITGTPSNYIKFTKSGDGSTATASYVASLSTFSWNKSYNGYYDGSGNLCIADEYYEASTGVLTGVRTFFGRIGKYIYDLLFVRSSGGGYAADKLMSYSDSTGRIAKNSGVSAAPSATGLLDTELQLPTSKNVRDYIGFLADWTAGLAGGTGSKLVEQLAKKLYDLLYTHSEDGGYATDGLVSYKGTTGRIVKTTNGKLSRIADGYAGTDDNLFPSQDAIGSSADHTTGQGGSTGGSLMQQIGYLLRSGLTTTNIFGAASGSNINVLSEKYTASISPTAGQWINIAECSATSTAKRFCFIVEYICSSTYYSGSFMVTGLIVEGSSIFNIEFKHLTGRASALASYGKVRIVSSNDTTGRGQYLQFESPAAITTSMQVVVRGAYTGGVWSFITPAVWASGNLPSGVAYATFGQASADFWRFPKGPVLISSGTKTPGATSGNVPFSGFKSLMFDKYEIMGVTTGNVAIDGNYVCGEKRGREIITAATRSTYGGTFSGMSFGCYFSNHPTDPDTFSIGNTTGSDIDYSLYGINY